MSAPRFGLTIGIIPEDLTDFVTRVDEKPQLWILHTCDFEGMHKDGQVLGLLPIGTPEGWTLHSVDPVTVHPSIQCGSCSFHGFIIDGEWYPA